MTLLAGLQAMLSRCSGQAEFWLATLVAKRNQPEIEDLIGLFVNTVLVRCSVQGGSTYRELLRSTRHAVLEAFQREEIPFEVFIQTLERERGIDRGRLCPVLFIMQNAPMASLDLPGVRVTTLESRGTGEREVYPTTFELIINVDEQPQRLIVSIGYKSELFNRERINRMAEEWGTVLESIVEEQVPISEPRN